MRTLARLLVIGVVILAPLALGLGAGTRGRVLEDRANLGSLLPSPYSLTTSIAIDTRIDYRGEFDCGVVCRGRAHDLSLRHTHNRRLDDSRTACVPAWSKRC